MLASSSFFPGKKSRRNSKNCLGESALFTAKPLTRVSYYYQQLTTPHFTQPVKGNRAKA